MPAFKLLYSRKCTAIRNIRPPKYCHSLPKMVKTANAPHSIIKSKPIEIKQPVARKDYAKVETKAPESKKVLETKPEEKKVEV